MAPVKSIAQQKSGAAAPLLKRNPEKLYAPMPIFSATFPRATQQRSTGWLICHIDALGED
jgi:hypothetical protein